MPQTTSFSMRLPPALVNGDSAALLHLRRQCVLLHVQLTQPCSAQTPHDSVTRFLRASRARNTRTPALLGDRLFRSAKAFTGTPSTSIVCIASAYSGLSVAANLATHAQISASTSGGADS